MVPSEVNCLEVNCPVRIKVDKVNLKVLAVVGEHDKHMVRSTPSTPTPKRNTPPPLPAGTAASTPISSDVSTKVKFTKPKEKGPAADTGNNNDGYITVIDDGDARSTQGGDPTINNDAFKSVINPDILTNEFDQEELSQNEEEKTYKIRYEEMCKVRDSLIDRIMIKERKIMEQENEIKNMKFTLNNTDNEQLKSEFQNLKEELKQEKSLTVQLKTTISTMEAGWEVDKNELMNLHRRSQEQTSLSPDVINKPTQLKSAQPKPAQTNLAQQKTAQFQEVKAGPSRIQVTVMGDSHVRHMDEVLKSKLPKHCDVKCCFKPGSRVEELNEMKIRTHSEQDMIILFSGANDVSRTSMKSVRDSFMKIVDKNNHCSVGIVLVPLRRNTCNINSHIRDFNAKCISFFQGKQVLLIDPNTVLNSNDYCNDNLHLNKVGKAKVGALIYDCIVNKTNKTQNYVKSTDIKNTKIQKVKTPNNTKQVSKSPPILNQTHQQRVKEYDYGKVHHSTRYSKPVRYNYQCRGNFGRYNYNMRYQNKYNTHNINRYTHFRDPQYLGSRIPNRYMYAYPQHRHSNRTFYNTYLHNKVRGQYNLGQNRRVHFDDRWDAAGQNRAVKHDRFFSTR